MFQNPTVIQESEKYIWPIALLIVQNVFFDVYIEIFKLITESFCNY